MMILVLLLVGLCFGQQQTILLNEWKTENALTESSSLSVTNAFDGDITWKTSSSLSRREVEIAYTITTSDGSDGSKLVAYEVDESDNYVGINIVASNIDETQSSSSMSLTPSSLLFSAAALATSSLTGDKRAVGFAAGLTTAAMITRVMGTSITRVDITITVSESLKLNFVTLNSLSGSSSIAGIDNIANPFCGCSSCCSGNGICNNGECTCNDGWTGSDCSERLPAYLDNRSGLPNGGSLVRWTIFRGVRLLVLSHSNISRSGLYYWNETESSWLIIGSGRYRTLVIPQNDDSKYFYAIRQSPNVVVRIDIDTFDIQRWDNQGSSSPNGAFSGSWVGIDHVMLHTNTRNPRIWLLNIESGNWTDTLFPYTDLDGKPHIEMNEDENGLVFYKSNYDGTFMYDTLSGQWSKPINVILESNAFRTQARNSRAPNPLTSCSNPIALTDKWTVLSNGLPPFYRSHGLVQWNGYLWMSVGGSILNGLYAFDGCRWRHIAYPPSKYGLNGIIVAGGKLYANGHGSLHRFDINDYSWIHSGRFISRDGSISRLTSGSSDSIYFFSGDTTNPQIWKLSLTGDNKISASVDNTNFPFRNLDGKPHVTILEDHDGNVWYKSNYNGIFKRHDGEWVRVNNRSGEISIGSDGKVYLSFEITPTTQISTFFLYEFMNGQHNWRQVQTTRGYGIDCKPFARDGKIFCEGGRFGQFIIHNTKLWRLPWISSGLNLTNQESLSTTCTSYLSIIDHDSIICIHRFDKDGNNHIRVIGIKIDTNILSYYDSNLEIQSGTYLTSINGKSVSVKILSNGNIVAGFNSLDNSYDQDKIMQLLSSNSSDDMSRVMVLNNDATQVIKIFVLPGSVLDISVSQNDDTVVIATTEHVVSLNVSSDTINWSYQYKSSKKRVTLSNDGRVASMIENNKFIVFHGGNGGNGGQIIYQRSVSRSYTEDVELDSESNLLFITGFDNKRLPNGLPVQVAFLQAYNLSLSNDSSVVWNRFGFNGQDLSRNIADTRLYRISMGQDGKLCILGESAGSETIFRFDGTSYHGNTILRSIDFYNDLWNTASSHIAYHARVDKLTGDITDSQLTMARLPGGKSNSFRVSDISADENGSTYVVGTVAAFYANRDATSINGIPVGSYSGDPSFLWLNRDFTNRNAWVSFIRNKLGRTNGGSLISVDSKQGKVVIIGDINSGSDSPITQNAILSSNDLTAESSSLVYLAVISTNDR